MSKNRQVQKKSVRPSLSGILEYVNVVTTGETARLPPTRRTADSVEHVGHYSPPALLRIYSRLGALSALFEDSCLFLVPGSQALPRSDEQRIQSSTMDPPKNPLDMPGAIRVTVKRMFYHCVIYGFTRSH